MTDKLIDKTERFVMLPYWVQDNYAKELGSIGIAVYCAIKRHANSDGENAWPSYTRIAKLAGCSFSSARRAVDKLVALGLITKELRQGADGGQTSNLYAIMPHRAAPCPQGADPLPIEGIPPAHTGQRTISPELDPNELDPNKGGGKKPPPPPAIQGYRKATHLYPTKSLWPGIVKVVGDEPADLARFEKVCTAWVAMGWNKKNVKGMLQHYSENRIPGDDGPAKGKGNASHQQKRINIQGHIPTAATPEEFYSGTG